MAINIFLLLLNYGSMWWVAHSGNVTFTIASGVTVLIVAMWMNK